MTNRKDLHKLAELLGGLPVLGCRPDSPADRAGLTYGDIVLSVNGMATSDWPSFIEARSLSRHTMDLEVFRDGAQMRMIVPLDQSAAPDPADVLAEIIAERLVPLELTPPPLAAAKPN